MRQDGRHGCRARETAKLLLHLHLLREELLLLLRGEQEGGFAFATSRETLTLFLRHAGPTLTFRLGTLVVLGAYFCVGAGGEAGFGGRQQWRVESAHTGRQR